VAGDILLGLGAILALGVASQWFAWRVRLPSILVLLVAGFLAGSVTGWLDPDALFGDLLFPGVAVAVGIILFEGGLSLSLKEIRGHGPAVTRLITVGALVAWLAGAAAAHLLAGLSWPIALLVGAILVVTGPTVVGPLLRHVRPRGPVGAVVKWEGILIDPVGALLAVIVFKATFAASLAEVTGLVGTGVVRSVATGVFMGALGAGALYVMLSRRWLPDHLESPIVLSSVVAVFVASDLLASESGLLATTLMGVALANQSRVHVHRIVEFKENLRVLLIAVLFIALAARVRLEDLAAVGVGGILFVTALLFVVRPASVLASTVGTSLAWRERAFVAWLAPRGIVAAAVASIFALRLEAAGHPEAGRLVPLVFTAIVATVAVYGLTSGPVARALGLSGPRPQGALVVGAGSFARAFASALRAEGHGVLLVDTNLKNVEAARAAGLDATPSDALAETFREDLDRDDLGRLAAMTPNDEVNSLASLAYAGRFGRNEVYQTATAAMAREGAATSAVGHLHGRVLFGDEETLASLEARLDAGDRVHTAVVAPDGTVAARAGPSGKAPTPLFVTDEGRLVLATAADDAALKPGSRLTYLGGEAEKPT